MHHIRLAAAVLMWAATLAEPLEAQAAAAAPAEDTAAAGAPVGAGMSRRASPTAAVATQPPGEAPLIESSVQSRSAWRPLNVAKWTTAAAATGLAVYGVISNRRADERFEELEQSCVDDPFRCSERLPDGSYADAAMESRYQDVRALDRTARTALIAGQVGVGVSVVLFLLDLRNSNGPENIPYEPRTLDVMPARDGGLSMRLNLRLPYGR